MSEEKAVMHLNAPASPKQKALITEYIGEFPEVIVTRQGANLAIRAMREAKMSGITLGKLILSQDCFAKAFDENAVVKIPTADPLLIGGVCISAILKEKKEAPMAATPTPTPAPTPTPVKVEVSPEVLAHGKIKVAGIILDVLDPGTVPMDKVSAKQNIFGLEKEVRAMAAGLRDKKNIILIGEAGTAKNTLCRHFSNITNTPLVRVNVDGGTTADNIGGKWKLTKEGMDWIEGLLTLAMRMGWYFVCDEINMMLPEIAAMFHAVLDDDRSLTLTSKDGETIKAHPNFRFIATMNPPGYAGVLPLNKALLSRFAIKLRLHYLPMDEEAKMVGSMTGFTRTVDLKKMVKIAAETRKLYAEKKISAPITPRDVLAWAEYAREFGPEEAAQFTVLNTVEDARHVKALLDIMSAFYPEIKTKIVVTE